MRDIIITLVVIGLTTLLACYHACNIGRDMGKPKEQWNKKRLTTMFAAMFFMCGMTLWNSFNMINKAYPISYTDLAAGNYTVKTIVYSIEGGATTSSAFVQLPNDSLKIVKLPSEDSYIDVVKGYVVPTKCGGKRIIHIERSMNQFGPETITLAVLSERDSASRFLEEAQHASR